MIKVIPKNEVSHIKKLRKEYKKLSLDTSVGDKKILNSLADLRDSIHNANKRYWKDLSDTDS